MRRIYLLLLLLLAAGLLAGCESDVQRELVVTITSPIGGETFERGEVLTFSATDEMIGDSWDHETDFRWVSSIDGEIGAAPYFTSDDLSVGVHAIEVQASTADDRYSYEDTHAIAIAITPAFWLVGDYLKLDTTTPYDPYTGTCTLEFTIVPPEGAPGATCEQIGEALLTAVQVPTGCVWDTGPEDLKLTLVLRRSDCDSPQDSLLYRTILAVPLFER